MGFPSTHTKFVQNHSNVELFYAYRGYRSLLEGYGK